MSPRVRLSRRQRRLLPSYRKKKSPIFGPNDYTLVAPSSSSILLTDENVTIASKLFGNYFDTKLRCFVIKSWFPGLLFQLGCFPIGLMTLTGQLSPAMALVTFPGALFPCLLLLRSHWIVFIALLGCWEPLFITTYSVIFCLSLSYLIMFDLRMIFVWMVIFPALLASTFGDASAVRLDYAFLNGDLSITALTMPPYLVSLAFIFSIIVMSNNGINDERMDTSSVHVMANIINTSLNFTYIASSTGSTICLFIIKSIAMLYIDPSRCNSLDASMSMDIVTLNNVLKPKVLRRERSMIGRICDAVRTPSIDHKTVSGMPLGFSSDGIGLKRVIGQSGQTKSKAFESVRSASLRYTLPRGNSIIGDASLGNSNDNNSTADVMVGSPDNPSNDEGKYTPDSGKHILQARFILKGEIGLEPMSRRVMSPKSSFKALNQADILGSRGLPNAGSLTRSFDEKESPDKRVVSQLLSINSVRISNADCESPSSQRVRTSINRVQSLEYISGLSTMGEDSTYFLSNHTFSYDANLASAALQIEERGDVIIRREEERGDVITRREERGDAVTRREEERGDAIIRREEERGDAITGREEERGDVITRREEERGDAITRWEEERGDVITRREEERGDAITKREDNLINSRVSGANAADNPSDQHRIDIKALPMQSNLTDRQKRLLPFYSSANAALFGPHQYAMLSPVTSSIAVSDENYTVASHLFGEAFDSRLRRNVYYLWYPALFFQIGCMPIGLLTLMGVLPSEAALATVPGALFPAIVLLQCHWTIFKALLYDWEQLFINFFSGIFCSTMTLIVHWDVRIVYIWMVVFPALFSSAFSDASATRLDHSFLSKKKPESVLKSVFLRAMPPYIASLTYILSIIAILNLKVPLKFDILTSLTVHTTVLKADLSYGVTASSIGFTICLFLLKYICLMLMYPRSCVLFRSRMMLNIAYLEPQPESEKERSEGYYVFESTFFFNRSKTKKKEGCLASVRGACTKTRKLNDYKKEIRINFCHANPESSDQGVELGLEIPRKKHSFTKRLNLSSRNLSFPIRRRSAPIFASQQQRSTVESKSIVGFSSTRRLNVLHSIRRQGEGDS